MPELTKQDVKEAVGEALEPFASAIQQEFQKIDNRFDLLEERLGKLGVQLGKLEDDAAYLRQWTSLLDQQIDDIKRALKKVVYRDELEALETRITRLESIIEKSGIKN